MSDGIAIGEQAYRKLTDAWLSAANDILEIYDKETLREFRIAFGRNPAHIRKAVERFPDTWNPDHHPDLFELLATIQLSKVKDDSQAIALFEDWSTNVERDYDDLKESIAELNGNGKPRVKHCKRCQRLDEIMHGRDFIHKAELYQLLDADKPIVNTAGLAELIAELYLKWGKIDRAIPLHELSALPEVAAVLKRKAAK